MAKGMMLIRLWKSKGGAFFMFVVYVIMVIALSLLNIDFYQIPTSLAYLVVPGALFVSVSGGAGTYLGVPTLALVVSLVMYMALGYLVDFLWEPYK